MRILEAIKFAMYQMKAGFRAGVITQRGDEQDFTPSILDDWITRQHIVKALRRKGYRVAEFPNPFRLNAYKGSEEFIIGCPNTSKFSTPWGLRASKPYVSVLPIKWVPNRTGVVGAEEFGKHYAEISNLVQPFGEAVL